MKKPYFKTLSTKYFMIIQAFPTYNMDFQKSLPDLKLTFYRFSKICCADLRDYTPKHSAPDLTTAVRMRPLSEASLPHNERDRRGRALKWETLVS